MKQAESIKSKWLAIAVVFIIMAAAFPIVCAEGAAIDPKAAANLGVLADLLRSTAGQTDPSGAPDHIYFRKAFVPEDAKNLITNNIEESELKSSPKQVVLTRSTGLNELYLAISKVNQGNDLYFVTADLTCDSVKSKVAANNAQGIWRFVKDTATDVAGKITGNYRVTVEKWGVDSESGEYNKDPNGKINAVVISDVLSDGIHKVDKSYLTETTLIKLTKIDAEDLPYFRKATQRFTVCQFASKIGADSIDIGMGDPLARKYNLPSITNYNDTSAGTQWSPVPTSKEIYFGKPAAFKLMISNVNPGLPLFLSISKDCKAVRNEFENAGGHTSSDSVWSRLKTGAKEVFNAVKLKASNFFSSEKPTQQITVGSMSADSLPDSGDVSPDKIIMVDGPKITKEKYMWEINQWNGTAIAERFKSAKGENFSFYACQFSDDESLEGKATITFGKAPEATCKSLSECAAKASLSLIKGIFFLTEHKQPPATTATPPVNAPTPATVTPAAASAAAAPSNPISATAEFDIPDGDFAGQDTFGPGSAIIEGYPFETDFKILVKFSDVPVGSKIGRINFETNEILQCWDTQTSIASVSKCAPVVIYKGTGQLNSDYADRLAVPLNEGQDQLVLYMQPIESTGMQGSLVIELDDGTILRAELEGDIADIIDYVGAGTGAAYPEQTIVEDILAARPADDTPIAAEGFKVTGITISNNDYVGPEEFKPNGTMDAVIEIEIDVPENEEYVIESIVHNDPVAGDWTTGLEAGYSPILVDKKNNSNDEYSPITDWQDPLNLSLKNGKNKIHLYEDVVDESLDGTLTIKLVDGREFELAVKGKLGEPKTPDAQKDITIDGLETKILNKVNANRSASNIPALKKDAGLDKIAGEFEGRRAVSLDEIIQKVNGNYATYAENGTISFFGAIFNSGNSKNCNSNPKAITSQDDLVDCLLENYGAQLNNGNVNSIGVWASGNGENIEVYVLMAKLLRQTAFDGKGPSAGSTAHFWSYNGGVVTNLNTGGIFGLGVSGNKVEPGKNVRVISSRTTDSAPFDVLLLQVQPGSKVLTYFKRYDDPAKGTEGEWISDPMPTKVTDWFAEGDNKFGMLLPGKYAIVSQSEQESGGVDFHNFAFTPEGAEYYNQLKADFEARWLEKWANTPASEPGTATAFEPNEITDPLPEGIKSTDEFLMEATAGLSDEDHVGPIEYKPDGKKDYKVDLEFFGVKQGKKIKSIVIMIGGSGPLFQAGTYNYNPISVVADGQVRNTKPTNSIGVSLKPMSDKITLYFSNKDADGRTDVPLARFEKVGVKVDFTDETSIEGLITVENTGSTAAATENAAPTANKVEQVEFDEAEIESLVFEKGKEIRANALGIKTNAYDAALAAQAKAEAAKANAAKGFGPNPDSYMGYFTVNLKEASMSSNDNVADKVISDIIGGASPKEAIMDRKITRLGVGAVIDQSTGMAYIVLKLGE